MFEDLIAWAGENEVELKALKAQLDEIDREGGERVQELEELIPDELRELCAHSWALELALRICRSL